MVVSSIAWQVMQSITERAECGHRPARSRQSGASLRCHTASLLPSDSSAHTSSVGNTPGALSPTASVDGRFSAPHSDNADRSAQRETPRHHRIHLRKEQFPPRLLLLHRVAEARKGRLFRHRKDSLQGCPSLPDHTGCGRFFRRSLRRCSPPISRGKRPPSRPQGRGQIKTRNMFL